MVSGVRTPRGSTKWPSAQAAGQARTPAEREATRPGQPRRYPGLAPSRRALGDHCVRIEVLSTWTGARWRALEVPARQPRSGLVSHGAAGRNPSRRSITIVLHSCGGMAEWLMAAVLKTAVPERVSGVRIPLPPPDSRFRSPLAERDGFRHAAARSARRQRARIPAVPISLASLAAGGARRLQARGGALGAPRPAHRQRARIPRSSDLARFARLWRRETASGTRRRARRTASGLESPQFRSLARLIASPLAAARRLQAQRPCGLPARSRDCSLSPARCAAQ